MQITLTPLVHAAYDPAWTNVRELQINVDAQNRPISKDIAYNERDDLGNLICAGDTARADALQGSTGGDVIQGRASQDTLRAGAGNDRLFADAALTAAQLAALTTDTAGSPDTGDSLFGEDGNDLLAGGAGGRGDDRITVLGTGSASRRWRDGGWLWATANHAQWRGAA